MQLSRRDYLALLGAGAALAATPGGDADREQRMQWWHQARFGMFIHWGLYSVLGRHEWAMEEEGIPVAEYQLLAKRFTPCLLYTSSVMANSGLLIEEVYAHRATVVPAIS